MGLTNPPPPPPKRALLVSIASAGGIAFVAWLDVVSPPDLLFLPWFAVPVAIASWWGGRSIGQVIGALSITAWIVTLRMHGLQYFPTPAILAGNVLVQAVAYLTVAILVSKQRQRFDDARSLAARDALTGLPNARGFDELAQRELLRSRRAGESITFAYLDLDGFKAVNDTHGHQVGDRLLIEVGDILQKTLRRTDVLGRLGGDEFAVVMPSTGADAAQTTLEHVRAEISARMRELSYGVSVSIGAVSAVAPPETVAELVRDADAAMYSVKRHGRNAVSVMDPVQSRRLPTKH
jgi:diguanylate cyclase (GGDEF)-like protein